MTDLDPTRQVLETWESVSPAWERHRDRVFEMTRPVSDWLVEHVAPGPGQTVLEVGAGPGETGFLAAARVGGGGRLVSSDLSPGMVEAARRGAAARGLTNVEHRVMDAQAMDLPDDSVDGVLSRFALMLVPAPERAFAEVRRVLRPGGRFAYATWGGPDRNPWVTVLVGALLQNGHVPGAGDPTAPGGLFSLASAEANARALEAAGFTDVTTDEVTGAMTFGSFDEYWDTQTSIAGPVARLLASLDPDQTAAIRASAEAAAEPFRADGGYALPYTAAVAGAG